MLEGLAAAYAEQILSAASYCHDRGPNDALWPLRDSTVVPNCSEQECFTATSNPRTSSS